MPAVADWGLAEAVRPRADFEGTSVVRPQGWRSRNPVVRGDFSRARGEKRPRLVRSAEGSDPITRVVDGVDDVSQKAVREELREGADQIKVMGVRRDRFGYSGRAATVSRPEELLAVVDEAETSRHLRDGFHAYGSAAVRRCLEVGVRSIEHGSLIDAGRRPASSQSGEHSLVADLEASSPGLRERGENGRATALEKRPRLSAASSRARSPGIEAARACGCQDRVTAVISKANCMPCNHASFSLLKGRSPLPGCRGP